MGFFTIFNSSPYSKAVDLQISQQDNDQVINDCTTNDIILAPRIKSEKSESHFEVLAFVDGSNWKKTGLKSDDIIIKIDTQEIHSAVNLLQLFKIAENEGEHTLYILRNKKKIQLMFHGPLFCQKSKPEANFEITPKIMKSLGEDKFEFTQFVNLKGTLVSKLISVIKCSEHEKYFCCENDISKPLKMLDLTVDPPKENTGPNNKTKFILIRNSDGTIKVSNEKKTCP